MPPHFVKCRILLPMSSNFVFFGTPYVARDTLAHLLEKGFTPSLVVTSPDAPKGRGLTLTKSDTRLYAEEKGIPVFAPEKLDAEALATITKNAPTFAVVVAYGKFLPEALIRAFPHGVVNVHYSLLPKYRGASPVEAAIRAGEMVTGVSIQRMVKEMDAGDILASREVSILPDDTTLTLRPRLIETGAELLVSLIGQLQKGEVTGTQQNHSEATFAKKIDKGMGELNLEGDAKENWNTYRAYAESPGTYFFMERNGKKVRVKIKTATFQNGQFVPLRIVPEGKKEMNYSDYTS